MTIQVKRSPKIFYLFPNGVAGWWWVQTASKSFSIEGGFSFTELRKNNLLLRNFLSRRRKFTTLNVKVHSSDLSVKGFYKHPRIHNNPGNVLPTFRAADPDLSLYPKYTQFVEVMWERAGRVSENSEK